MAVGDANGTRFTEDDYQFGWEPLSPEPSPGGRRPEPASSVLQNPAILSLMVVLAMAVLILCYYKIVSRFLASCPRRAPEPESAGAGGNAEPAPDADADFFPADGPWAAVPCGVDEAVIRAIPVAKFCTARKLLSSPADCAVCLVEFREQEPVRVLPRCGHAFHLPCIDAWLRSHASCPLCRACIAASLSRRWDWYDSQPEQPDETGVPEPAAGPAPKLTRSVSLGRVAADDSGSLLMSAGFDPETPWPPAPAPARRPPGSKWSKRTLSLVSPFVPRSSSSFFGRSPFFRASSGTALSFRFGRRFRGGSFSMSPPHGGGLWRGGVVSEHYVNVGRFQCMSSPPVFVKRSSGTFSFTPNRMRAGDPEALLSPERINLSRRWP